jgi:hypothetical protein
MLVLNLEAGIQLLDDVSRGLVDWLEERVWKELASADRQQSPGKLALPTSPSVLGYDGLKGLPGPIDPLLVEIEAYHGLLNAPFQCDRSVNPPNGTRYAQTHQTVGFPVVLILSICKFFNLVSHHNPKLLLTPSLTLFSNSALCSLHIFAASTFAGLSSFGSASIDITLMRIFSTL